MKSFVLAISQKWRTYLEKIAAVMGDVDVLLRAAFSPRCRRLFKMTFKMHTIPGFTSRALRVSQSAADWEHVLEKALSQRNSSTRQPYESERKVMNMSVIRRDAADMAQVVISRDLVVHCEVKVLLHIAKS